MQQPILGLETPGMRLLRLLRREFGGFVSMTHVFTVPAKTLARFEAVAEAFIAETREAEMHER